MPANKISLDNAKPEKLFYFVANVVVFRPSDGRCLLLKRSEREKAHPGRYGVLGGKLEWKDLPIDRPTRTNGDVLDFEHAVEELLIREVKEEAGVTIDPKLTYIDSVAYIRPDETPSILVKFAATYKSGDVILEEDSFSDFAWVNAEEVEALDCIGGIKDEVDRTIDLLTS